MALCWEVRSNCELFSQMRAQIQGTNKGIQKEQYSKTDMSSPCFVVYAPAPFMNTTKQGELRSVFITLFGSLGFKVHEQKCERGLGVFTVPVGAILT